MHSDAVLVMLRIKGIAKPDVLAAALEADPGAVSHELDRLAARDLAEEAKTGWRLTAAGRATADAVVATERTATDPHEMEAAYERFTDLNDRFKATITAWQLREIGGTTVPNDHADVAYDARILRSIESIHRELARLLETVATRVPRTASYRSRFERALDKATCGENRYVAAPNIESYHTVWFEFHEDLIGLTGKTRTAEAAAGRGA